MRSKRETQHHIGYATLYDGEGIYTVHYTLCLALYSPACIGIHYYRYDQCIPVGHRNVREAMKMQSARDTPITFRKKRAVRTTENRVLSKAAVLTPPSTADHPPRDRVAASSSGSGARGVKRKATGTVTAPRKVLQLHNYFSRV